MRTGQDRQLVLALEMLSALVMACRAKAFQCECDLTAVLALSLHKLKKKKKDMMNTKGYLAMHIKLKVT